MEKLYALPPGSEDALEAEVRAYVERLRREGRRVEFLDLSLVEKIGRSAIELLSLCRGGLPEDGRRLAHAAVRYFVLEDDGDGDLDSPLGFDDDAEVVSAVAEHLGRPDLSCRAS